MLTASYIVIFALLYSCVAGQSNCRVANIEIQLVQNGTGYNATYVKSLLTKYEIRFANPETDYMSCVDGRAYWPDYATPGGDAGEFLLALSVFSRNGGNVSTYAQVKDLFQRFLLTLHPSRDFYMHTDTHALDHLAEELNTTHNITYFDIFNVPLNIQSVVLEALGEPSNIGCGHVRLTSQHPDQYQLETEITQNFVRAFYDTLWNGFAKVNLHVINVTILHHDHAELAVVSVFANSTEACSKYAPLLIADTDVSDVHGGSVYLNHPQYTDVIRVLLSNFFARELGISNTTFRTRLEEISAIALTYSLGYLAPGLPIYQAVLTVTDAPITTGSLLGTSGVLQSSTTTTGTNAEGTTGDDVSSANALNIALFLLYIGMMLVSQ